MPDLSHRKSSVTLTLRDKAGIPMAGQTVEAELVSHEFMFGCGVFFAVPLCILYAISPRRLRPMLYSPAALLAIAAAIAAWFIGRNL